MIGNGTIYVYQYRMVWTLLGIALVIAIIACAILLALWIVESGGRDTRVQDEDSALDILDKRYAKGEISKEQYIKMKRDVSTK